MPALVLEDISNGKKAAIPSTAVTLGKTSTIRLDVEKGVFAGVQWAVRSNGKSVEGLGDWTDRYYPFRLVPQDKPLALPAGVYTVSCQPVDANNKAAGGAIVATLTVAGAPNVPTKPNTDADPVPTVPPVKEELPAIQWGICGNELDGVAKFTTAFGKARADGGKWGRLWHSHFGKISEATGDIVGNVHSAGGKNILCVQPKDGGVENFGTPDFAKFVALNADVLKKCEYVEAGNELHCFGSKKYLPDDFGKDWYVPYVERWLKPLSKELRKIGVKTMLTSTTDKVEVAMYQPHAERLKAAGACDWCDAVATHIYATPADFDNIAPVLTMLRDVYGKPIVITEAAPSKQVIKPKDFPARFAEYAVEVRKGNPLAAVWYRGLVHPNAKEWPAELSLFGPDLTPTASYVALLNAVKA